MYNTLPSCRGLVVGADIREIGDKVVGCIVCWEEMSVEKNVCWDFPNHPYVVVPIVFNGMGSVCYLMALKLMAETGNTSYLMVPQFLDHLPVEI